MSRDLAAATRQSAPDIIAEETMDDPNADADMGAVHEAESDEEMGIVHGDVEHEISAMLLAQLGRPSKSYTRGPGKGCRHSVSEIYSPPMITREIKNGRFRNLFLPAR